MSLLKRIGIISLICCTTSVLSGCMIIFSRNHQTVKIEAANPKATIYHNGDSVGVGSATVRLDKRYLFECVKLKADGYLTKNYTFGTTKYSPALAVAALDMAGLLLSIQKVVPRLRRFDNEIQVPPLTESRSRQPSEKYILVNKFSIDTKEEDFVIKQHNTYKKYLAYLKKGTEPSTAASKKFPSDTRKSFKIEHSSCAEYLTDILKQMNFIDTTVNFLKNDLNTLYINATVHKIKIHVVNYINPNANSSGPWNYSNMLVLELDIKWDVVNRYDQPIYSSKTTLYSDGFQFEAVTNKIPCDANVNRKLKDTVYVMEALNKALKNNINYAFLQLKDELTQKNLLTSNDLKDSMETMTIHKGTTIVSDKIGAYLDASVSVKVDGGHGSGFCISNDGYILTNYHVVANTKNIEVIFNDGSKEQATLLRYSKTGDIALLRVNRQNLLPFNLSNIELPKEGTDVWAIGTPKNIELGQSVSKGIVSSYQKGTAVSYIQTDVKISPGNSGGPLVGKGGLLLGMVSMKVIDNQTEGIGFAIFAPEILRLLKIDLKD
jgi:serine protease Do